MLNLYREALARRPEIWVDAGDLEWIATDSGVAAFQRGTVQCWVNTGEVPVALPGNARVVLASVSGVTTSLPPDAAAWLVGMEGWGSADV